MQILVIKPSALGDVLHGMVVINELKKQFPECVIVWVASDKFAEVVILSKIARNVFIYRLHGDMFSFFFRLIAKIHNESYNHVFDMPAPARSSIMTATAKSPDKIGCQDTRELSFSASTQKINYPVPRTQWIFFGNS